MSRQLDLRELAMMEPSVRRRNVPAKLCLDTLYLTSAKGFTGVTIHNIVVDTMRVARSVHIGPMLVTRSPEPANTATTSVAPPLGPLPSTPWMNVALNLLATAVVIPRVIM
jgi:hypothetical protein